MIYTSVRSYAKNFINALIILSSSQFDFLDTNIIKMFKHNVSINGYEIMRYKLYAKEKIFSCNEDSKMQECKQARLGLQKSILLHKLVNYALHKRF